MNLIKHIFALGDVVRLKCGGPKMVVFGLDGCDVYCAWHLADGGMATSHVNAVALNLEPAEHKTGVYR